MALVACYECAKQISASASACPQCGAPKPKSTFSANVRQQLVAATVIDGWDVFAWLFYGLFIPTIILGSNTFGLVIVFAAGIAAFRSWLSRRTACAILKRGNLDGSFVNIYLRSLWSYAWRSCLTFVAVGVGVGFGRSETPAEAGKAVGVVAALWILPSVFILDVPWWVRRKVERAIAAETIKDAHHRTAQSAEAGSQRSGEELS